MIHPFRQPASMRLCMLPWLVAPMLLLGSAWKGPQLRAQDDSVQDADDASSPSGNTTQATPLHSNWSADLADLLRPSIVEVSYLGREGKPEGIGTGVVIDSEQGLIATNLHVIGEAREIVVKTEDGQLPQVQQVWASDPQLDLAILKVRANGLIALRLGDSDDVRDGQPVLAIGNPHGLRNSVVAGVSSGKRVMDGKKLIQLAMPIEPGNSGGPLVTQDGKLVGIVSLKSNVTDNLGFAVEVNQLKELLARPNSIDIDRWLTIGALDGEEWEILGGATWRQQGGMIIAEGLGEGFGGRSLCLTKEAALQVPFELAVDVRLDDEAGAAGLVFSSDGGDRHYGFYPSQSALRFSRFEGPTVFQWNVVQQQQSPHYRQGEWNRLKVRCEEEGQFICMVNDRVVFKIQDRRLQGTRIGVAKFRDTRAQFRNFQVAGSIPSRLPGPELEQRLLDQIGTLPSWRELRADALQDFRGESLAAQALLERQARLLETQAAELRKVRQQLHLNDCLAGLRQVIESKELDPLIPGALWIARIDDPDLSMVAYQKRLQKIKEELRGRIETNMTARERLAELNEYLFQENGFHGSRTDYYHRANSYLNRVLDDREGIPLTLSILYRELAAALGVEMQGIGLPGHFLLQWTDPEGENHWIDAFENGRELPRDEVVKLGVQAAGYWDEEFLASVDSRQMLIRLLSNLRGIAESERSMEDLEKYVEALLVLEPDSVAFRGMRAVVRFENGRLAAALEDLDWVVQNPPPGIDLSTVLRMRQQFAERLELERGADGESVED
jgi:serine protease Do